MPGDNDCMYCGCTWKLHLWSGTITDPPTKSYCSCGKCPNFKSTRSVMLMAIARDYNRKEMISGRLAWML